MDAGFAPLSTEWWHFQDDATRDALALGTYQEKGISLEGWHRDLIGWYYCRPDGSRVCKDQAALGDRMITLDEAGYAVETGAAARKALLRPLNNKPKAGICPRQTPAFLRRRGGG